jgi:hypothetical protein
MIEYALIRQVIIKKMLYQTEIPKRSLTPSLSQRGEGMVRGAGLLKWT